MNLSPFPLCPRGDEIVDYAIDTCYEGSHPGMLSLLRGSTLRASQHGEVIEALNKRWPCGFDVDANRVAAKLFNQDDDSSDGLTLFSPFDGFVAESVFCEELVTMRSCEDRSMSRVLQLERRYTQNRSVSIVSTLTCIGSGLSLSAKPVWLLVDNLKRAASHLIWHGSSDLGVNGITGFTGTIHGYAGEHTPVKGKRHPDLAAKVSDVGALSAATFADAFEALVDAIDFAAVAYGDGFRPNAIIMGPDLWSRLGKIRDTSGSGKTLRAALVEHYPEIKPDQWKVSHNLKATGPGGYSGLLAYRSGPMGLAYRLSMTPVLTSPYRQGLEERIAGAMRIGGLMIGRQPGHCMAWFDAS